MSILKKVGCIFVSCLIISLSLFSAFSGGMSVKYTLICDGEPIEGCELYLYKVTNSDGSPTYDFSSYQVEFDLSDTESMANAAKTLTNYVEGGSILPLKSAKTNLAGNAELSIDSEGVYLIVGKKISSDGAEFTPDSILFSMPSTNENGDKITNLTLCPKCEKNEIGGSIKRKVLKSWKNDDESTRPNSITVELYCDSVLYDSVVLSNDNAWSYEWEDLDGSKTWSLTESNVPDGYSVSIALEGITFHVINTYAPSSSTSQSQTTTSSGGSTNKNETIPRTGVLWWPVPYVACVGLLLIIIGYVKKNKNNSTK